VALVGYTNAGKTSLLNIITKSKVRVEDKLFVTLDPTTRRVRFPGDQDVVLTDTVGFIRDLPADLITAFKATLEEVGEADLLLHVADIGDDQLEMKIDSVNRILSELEMNEIPRLLVLNKVDLLDPLETSNLCKRYNGIPVTTLDKKLLPGLLDLVGKELEQVAGGQGTGSKLEK